MHTLSSIGSVAPRPTAAAPPVEAQLDAIVNQICAHVPAMASHFGNESALDTYAGMVQEADPAATHQRRQEQLLPSVGEVLRSAFGPSADEFGVTAQTLRCANVVDHHQLLNHPLLLGANVLANAQELLAGERPIVVFSCSNINPANSFMRRGLLFNGKTLPYFAAREHRDALCYLPPRRFDFVERQERVGHWGDLSSSDREFWCSFQDLLNSLDYSHCAGHRDQVTVAVCRTWPLLFEPSLRHRLSELLYVNSEDVFRRFLMQTLDEENHVTAGILDPRFRAQVLRRFDGVFGAWDTANDRGTHFFWQKHPTEPRLVRMWVRGNSLVPADERFDGLSIPLEKEALRDALGRETLIPSVGLWISLLLFTGIQPLVGPNSLIYTTQLKEGWIDLLEETGETEEAALLRGVSTNRLIAGMPVFFARREQGVQALAATDVIAAGGVSEEYLSSLFSISFRDGLSVGASGIHDLLEGHSIPKAEPALPKPSLDAAAEAIHPWI